MQKYFEERVQHGDKYLGICTPLISTSMSINIWQLASEPHMEDGGWLNR